jgi:hypothetical protein
MNDRRRSRNRFSALLRTASARRAGRWPGTQGPRQPPLPLSLNTRELVVHVDDLPAPSCTSAPELGLAPELGRTGEQFTANATEFARECGQRMSVRGPAERACPCCGLPVTNFAKRPRLQKNGRRLQSCFSTQVLSPEETSATLPASLQKKCAGGASAEGQKRDLPQAVC